MDIVTLIVGLLVVVTGAFFGWKKLNTAMWGAYFAGVGLVLITSPRLSEISLSKTGLKATLRSAQPSPSQILQIQGRAIASITGTSLATSKPSDSVTTTSVVNVGNEFV